MSECTSTPPASTRVDSPHPQHALHGDGSKVDRLADILRRRADATPAGAAFLEASGSTTFAELDARANQVAQALLADGVIAGDRVAYVGGNSPSFVEVMNGAARIGAIFTALNNRLAPGEVAAILSDAVPAVIVVGRGDAALAPSEGTVPSLRRVISLDAGPGMTNYEQWLAPQPNEDPGHVGDPHDTAVLFYTSGTTGLPKGIELSGENIGQALATMHYEVEFGTHAVAMAPVPFFHVAGFGLALAAQLGGAALLLEQPTGVDSLIDLLVSRQVTHAVLVPTVLQGILNLPAGREADWSALEYVVYGAAPMPLSVIRTATELMACKFLQSYGLTESTGGVTMLNPEDHLPDEQHARRLTSVGKPLPGVPIRVVDPVTLEDMPAGARGEVLIGGGQVMKGYWRRPQASAAALLPGGWLRTGDGGSLDDDGYLYLHDRLKDMIISGGENVFPAEIESVLTAHPDVAEAAVVGVPSQRWGESPYAVVVRTSGAQLSENELLDWIRDRVARFKCPVGVRFVEHLPRTASGKLQKAQLRASVGGPPDDRSGQTGRAGR